MPRAIDEFDVVDGRLTEVAVCGGVAHNGDCEVAVGVGFHFDVGSHDDVGVVCFGSESEGYLAAAFAEALVVVDVFDVRNLEEGVALGVGDFGVGDLQVDSQRSGHDVVVVGFDGVCLN